MMMKLFCLRRLRRDQRGVSAVEFALIAPVAIALFMVIIEVSGALLAQGLLEMAASGGARLGSTGYVEPGSASREATVRDYVARQTFGLLDAGGIVFSPTAYASWDAIDSPPLPENQGSFGGPGQVVVYAFHYDWKGLTPLFSSILGDDAKVVLGAVKTVQNEPFAS